MANNSAVYDKKPSDTVFMEEWLSLAKSGSGERGIFNRDGVMRMLPKRRKKARFGTNPCFHPDTRIHTARLAKNLPRRFSFYQPAVGRTKPS